MSDFLLELRFDGLPRARARELGPALRGHVVRELLAAGVQCDRGRSGATCRRLVVALRLSDEGRDGERVVGAAVDAVLATFAPFSSAGNKRHGDWDVLEPVGALLLVNGKACQARVLGVETGATSIGHPVLSPDPFSPSTSEDYFSALEERGVLVQPAERRSTLFAALEERAKEAGAELSGVESLIDELVWSLESPGVITVDLPPVFRGLPEVLVEHCLKERLEVFPLRASAGGELLDRVLVVLDRPDDPDGAIGLGHSWRLTERLEDLAVLWARDRSEPLARFARELRTRRYGVGSGTWGERIDRVATLAESLCGDLGWQERADRAREAAQMAPADRATETVLEYPGLAGVVGALMARDEGYPESVWRAIAGGRCLGGATESPDDETAADAAVDAERFGVRQVVEIANALDLVASRAVTMSTRELEGADDAEVGRALYKVIKTLSRTRLPLDLDLATARAVRLQQRGARRSDEAVLMDLRPLRTRILRTVLAERGYQLGEVEAVLGAGGSSLIGDVEARLGLLTHLRGREGLARVVRTARRMVSILREAPEREVDPTRLREPAERALWETLERVRPVIRSVVTAPAAGARPEHERWLAGMLELGEVVERFMTEVLVRTDDDEQRQNRLGLVQAVHRVYSRSIRLAELEQDDGKNDTGTTPETAPQTSNAGSSSI